ncbi:MAG: sensor histidine kinase N-terminal domain-containing protein [Rhizobiaceae bacterium]|nr:sensor histidine kinase N-terminal domain-containing protein [Rhizobiaceae bacterium]
MAASIITLLLFFALAAFAAGTFTIHRELNEAMDRTLEQVARRLLPLAVDDLMAQDKTNAARELAQAVSMEHQPAIFQIRNGEGNVLIRSHEAPAEPLSKKLRLGFSESDGWHIFTVESLGGSVYVQVAQRQSYRREETMEAAAGFVYPMLALIPLSAFAIGLIVRRSAQPVKLLWTEIDQRHGDKLTSLALDSIPDELQGIARSVNGLMSRLAASIEAEREFSANAAHELRTPLAGALAQIEILKRAKLPKPEQQRVEEVARALSNLGQRTEKLLQLARSNYDQLPQSTVCNLSLVTRLVADEIARRSNDRDLILDLPANGPQVQFDADALAIVVRNLIENALDYSPENSAITVRVTESGTIETENETDFISPEVVERLTARYERQDKRGDGFGLGLAIVSRLVRQAGGDMRLQAEQISAGRSMFRAKIQCVVAV